MDSSAKAVRNKAAEILGSFQYADDWLCSPVRELDYKTPSDLLKIESGRAQLLEMLERIDRCDFFKLNG